MYPETFYPMAARNSVPRVCRRYHYEHNPPPEHPTEFAAELRRRLRGVDKRRGLWNKVKSVAWRIMLNVQDEQPLRRPDFPVAPPSTPVPRVRRIAPDIHIIPAGCPDYLLSPPPPQEDGFLFVPMHTYRARPRRQERPPPSPRPAPRPRPLPTPPGRPASPIPKIMCCPWANSPSTESSPTTPVDDSDVEEAVAQDRFFTEVAPFLFLAIKEDSSEDDEESQGSDSPDSSADSASSSQGLGTEDDIMTLDETQAEAIRDVAGDAEFLGEIGLTPQAFVALLDGTDMKWSRDQAGRD